MTAVIVYDFDLTLTRIHTKGTPDIGEEYFGSGIESLLRSPHPIYINTRGIKQKVEAYLESRSLLKYVVGVYGADTMEELGRNDSYWAARKVRVLDYIRQKHKLSKDHIFFYDDTEENIKVARANGYMNSYVVKPGSLCM